MCANQPKSSGALFEEALRTLPPPGQGCHPSLLGAANHGVRAGIPREEMIPRILASIPSGSRGVSEREVAQAVDKALGDAGKPWTPSSPQWRTYPKPVAKIDPVLYFREAGRKAGERYLLPDYEAEFWEASTVRMDWPPEEDAANVFRHLYAEDEHVYVGESDEVGRLGWNIRRARDWIDHFFAGRCTWPHVIANPLTGEKGLTKSGSSTYRGDACVKAYRYAVVEFDGLPKEEQAAFWLYADLPVAAIIDSGGKSLHGWVRMDARDADEWTISVEKRLFDQLLRPLGVDGACKNESRMSRLPGHVRENGNRQRLLYLAPEGKAVSK